jgi:hypothetical protein
VQNNFIVFKRGSGSFYLEKKPSFKIDGLLGVKPSIQTNVQLDINPYNWISRHPSI